MVNADANPVIFIDREGEISLNKENIIINSYPAKTSQYPFVSRNRREAKVFGKIGGKEMRLSTFANYNIRQSSVYKGFVPRRENSKKPFNRARVLRNPAS